MTARPLTLRGGASPARRRRRLSTALVLAAGAIAGVSSAAPVAVADPADPAPPPLTVLSRGPAVGQGDIFVTPTGATAPYANGAEILDRAGHELWFHAAPAGESDADFRAQTLDGRHVLTLWEGRGLGGPSDGTDEILDARGRPIASVHASDGLTTDGHEFLITPQNTALVLSYVPAKADLTSIGGPADQAVIDGVVQEIDIATGRVLFSWNSADHVPYGESEQPLPASASTPWDWFHVNAVKLDTDGNLLIDARNTWTAYKVDRHDGRILWQLGGKASSFTLRAAAGQSLNQAGEIFAWQHDPEALGHDRYTLFDNEAAGRFNLGVDVSAESTESRVVTVALDLRHRVATLVASDDQPRGRLASSQGNGQTLAGGNVFTGWGNLNEISEFDRAGQTVFDAEFPAGVNTYRAYLLPWAGGWADGRGSPDALLRGRRGRSRRGR